MKRIGVAVVVAGLIVWATSSATAQRPGGFGAGRGAGSLFLLTQKSVQEELKMSEEQTKKVTEMQEKQRENFKGGKDLSKEERMKKFEETAKANEKAIGEILKPEQTKRLKQITLQQAGSRAFSDPDVVSALKITDEQKEKLKTIQEDLRKEMTDLGKDGGREKFQEIRKKGEEKALGVLTDTQKKEFKDLTGEPFKGKIEFQGRPGGNKKKSTT